jgi:threonine synthase
MDTGPIGVHGPPAFLLTSLMMTFEAAPIAADERVGCLLTGHQLKDPTATVAYPGELPG